MASSLITMLEWLLLFVYLCNITIHCAFLKTNSFRIWLHDFLLQFSSECNGYMLRIQSHSWTGGIFRCKWEMRVYPIKMKWNSDIRESNHKKKCSKYFVWVKLYQKKPEVICATDHTQSSYKVLVFFLNIKKQDGQKKKKKTCNVSPNPKAITKTFNTNCHYTNNNSALWPVENETHLTQLSCKLQWALTHKAAQNCMTLTAILAWLASTLIPLDFTMSAHKTWRTQAVVTILALLKKTQQQNKSNGNFLVQVCAAVKSAKVICKVGFRSKLKHPYLACSSILALTMTAFGV